MADVTLDRVGESFQLAKSAVTVADAGDRLLCENSIRENVLLGFLGEITM